MIRIEIDITEFNCDTMSQGDLLYKKKQSVSTVLYRLYTDYSAFLRSILLHQAGAI